MTKMYGLKHMVTGEPLKFSVNVCDGVEYNGVRNTADVEFDPNGKHVWLTHSRVRAKSIIDRTDSGWGDLERPFTHAINPVDYNIFEVTLP